MAGITLPSEGVKDILVSAGIGVFASQSATEWSIRISKMEPKPDKMIAIFDVPGLPPQPGLDINYPALQIVVRGTPAGYVDSYAKAQRIVDELLGRDTETRGGDIWASVTMSSDIINLGYDDNERPMWSMNFQLIVHQGDLTHSHRDPC